MAGFFALYDAWHRFGSDIDMNLWNDRRVLIIGAARQGQALARALARWGAQVTLNDQRPETELEPVRNALQGLPVQIVGGGHPLELLEKADLVCLSGGVPLENPLAVGAVQRGIPVSNDTQIFMELVKAPVVGITGSAGKTTTTTLVGRMAKAGITAPRKAWVGGNIGNPLIEHVEEIAAGDLVVWNSHFQLETMTISPGCLPSTKHTPNHLDSQGTMEAYTPPKPASWFPEAPAIRCGQSVKSGAWGRCNVYGSLAVRSQPACGRSTVRYK